MEHIIVYKRAGGELILNSINPINHISRAEQRKERLGENVIEMSIESVGHLELSIGDKIVVFGEEYFLNSLPEPERVSESEFKYTLVFEGAQYELIKSMFRNADPEGLNPTGVFPLTGNLQSFLGVLIYNLSRTFGVGSWALGVVPEETDAKTLMFSNENCLQVLQKICQEYTTEFEIERSGTQHIIHIREANDVFPYTLKYGQGKGLYSIIRKNVDSKNIVTRLFVEGSERNIKIGYRDNATRLRLSTNLESSIEDSEAVTAFGVIEGAIVFDDVYPKRIGSVTNLGEANTVFMDSSMFNLVEKDNEGNHKYLVPGQPAKIHFNTGNLAGYEFEVLNYDHPSRSFRLKKYKDSRGLEFPGESSAFNFALGDKYVLLDIIMPDSYVEEAEEELLEKGIEYLSQNSQPRVEYSIRIDPEYLKIKFNSPGVIPNVFTLGHLIPIQDSQIGVDKSIRVKSFKRNILLPFEYEVVLSDILDVSIIQHIIASGTETNNLIQINHLNDPARARRNWRDAEELAGMVDSLRADVALIGNPETQFQLTSVFQANKNGNPDLFRAGSGVLAHFTIPSPEDPWTWNLSAWEGTVSQVSAYYVYAKCSRDNTIGTFVLSLTKIAHDSDLNFYHFLIGILSSKSDNTRGFNTTYGFTLISGREIKTGRISSVSGDAYFDLDQSEIGGNIKFLSGGQYFDVGSGINSAQSAANAAQSSANTANSLLGDIANDNKLTPSEKQSTKLEWDKIVSEKPKIDAEATRYEISNAAYTTAYNSLNTYITPLLSNLNTTSDIIGTTFRSKFKDYFDARQDLLNAITTKAKQLADNAYLMADTARLMAKASQSGKMLYRDPTFKSSLNGITVYNNSFGFGVSINRITAPSDCPSNSGFALKISFLSADPVSPGLGGFKFANQSRPSAVYVLRFVAKIPVNYYLEWYSGSYGTGSSYKWLTSKDGTGKYEEYILIAFCGSSGTFSTMNYVALHDQGVFEPMPVDWFLAFATVYDITDIDPDYTYLIDRILSGSTEVNGGLVLTHVLGVKDLQGNVKGGISGVDTANLLMWGGCGYQEALDMQASFRIWYNNLRRLRLHPTKMTNLTVSTTLTTGGSESIETSSTRTITFNATSIRNKVSILTFSISSGANPPQFSVTITGTLHLQSFVGGIWVNYDSGHEIVLNYLEGLSSKSLTNLVWDNIPPGNYRLRLWVRISRSGSISQNQTGAGNVTDIFVYQQEPQYLEIGPNGINIAQSNNSALSINSDPSTTEDFFNLRGNFRICSPDGRYQLRQSNSGLLKSSDYGVTWTAL